MKKLKTFKQYNEEVAVNSVSSGSVAGVTDNQTVVSNRAGDNYRKTNQKKKLPSCQTSTR